MHSPPAPPGTIRWSAHPRDGWAFWWRWVLATNLGWFTGILAGTSLAAPLEATHPLVAALVASAVAAACFGAAQAFALRDALPVPRAWWLATWAGWPAGVLVAELVLDALALQLAGVGRAIGVAAVAGGVTGAAQAAVLARVTGRWRHWPWVSALSWGVLFPGALSGVFLVLWWRPGHDDASAR